MGRVIELFRRRAPVDGASCRFEAYVPDRLQNGCLSLSAEVAARVCDAQREVLRLNETAGVLTDTEAFARFLLQVETTASARLAGQAIDRERRAEVQTAHVLGLPVRDSAARAAFSNAAALQMALDEISTRAEISLHDIQLIHQTLVPASDKSAGRLRSEPIWTGGSEGDPSRANLSAPPPELVPELLEDLVAFLNVDRYPALVQAALALAQIETIRPFDVGNGRTGRVLVQVVLRRRGLAPSCVPPISATLLSRSAEYVRCLRRYQYVGQADGRDARESIAACVDLLASVTERAAAEAKDHGPRLDALARKWLLQAAPVRADSAVDRLLRVLPSTPTVAIPLAARLIDRSEEATRLGVQRLVEVGVLRPLRDTRSYRTFEAVGGSAMLAELEQALSTPRND